MTKDEMSNIISAALRSYSWRNNSRPLPDFIADIIVGAGQPSQPSPTDLQRMVNERDAEIAKLRAESERLRHKLEDARAATPHFYIPSAAHMGDCLICGNEQAAPQHDVGQWKSRAEKAEADLKEALFRATCAESRANMAEATIAKAKEALS
jgi:hypothetical protein